MIDLNSHGTGLGTSSYISWNWSGNPKLHLMELVWEPQVKSHGNGLGTPSYNFSLFSIFDPCKKRKASKFQALKSHGMKTFVKKV